MLTCTRCGVEKPETSEFFPLHNKKKNGLDSWCRQCRSEYRSNISRGLYRDQISDADLIALKASTTECVICGNKEKLVVDHDHASGEIRGLLCNHCNRGLGHFRDDPDLLEYARIYLLSSRDDPEADKYLDTARSGGHYAAEC
jgi:hypothetical protein